MKIVILGASGNLGTSLLHLLRQSRADEVVAVARRGPSFDEPAPNVTWVERDTRQDELAPDLRGADAVVNLTWLFHPSHDPEQTWASNVGGTIRLLEAVRAAGVPRLIHSSSIAAYSPRKQAGEIGEDWPTDGASSAAYAREKAYIERLLDIFERDVPTCEVVRLRPAFVFQRDAATQQRRLFGGPLVPGRLIRPGLVPVLPFPSGLRLQTVHSVDVASAVDLALRADYRGALNICADGTLNAQDVAALLKARPVNIAPRLIGAALKASWHAHLVPADPKLFDALLALPTMANSRAKTELGWSPEYSADEALDEFLVGLRTGGSYPTPPLDDATSGPLRSQELVSGIGAAE